MRHRKHTCKLGKTTAHRRCMIANMLKSLVVHGRVETTIAKAKEVRRYADKLVTVAKKEDGVTARRRASAKLMIRYNKLTPKEKRNAKNGDASAYNDDRKVEEKLFVELKERYKDRAGGYTRIIKLSHFRAGDRAPMCILEYV